jgi:acyl-homoserine lactone synthase
VTFTLQIISPADRLRHRAVLQAAFRLRHRVFVEQKGWSILQRPDAVDIDRHDAAGATHICLLQGRAVIGHARLVPGGYLLAARRDDASIDRIAGEACVHGLSRFCVDGVPWTERSQASALLLIAALEQARRMDVQWLLFETSAALLFWLRVLGLDIRSVGEPGLTGRDTLHPVLLYVCPEAISTLSTRLDRWLTGSPTAHSGVLSVA